MDFKQLTIIYMNNMYNSPYYLNYNHKTFFKNVDVDKFLKEYKINTSACKELKNDFSNEFNEQMKLLHFLFNISSPLNDKSIYNNNYDFYGYTQTSKITNISLVCKRNDLPVHIGAYGDTPHFTLEITTNDSRKNYHLYLNGCLTLGRYQYYSLPIQEQFFNSYITLKKNTKKNTKLNPTAKPFIPK